VDWDPATEPIGTDPHGKPVFFRDVWPSSAEIADAMKTVTAALFRDEYGRVFEGDELWRGMPVPTGDRYAWDASSTYIKAPPFFEGMSKTAGTPTDIRGARCLVLLGDSITTDHISPAGSIKADSPAGRYLQSLGVGPKDFNSYGARRGNHEVMVRGTFANIRIKNQLVPGVEGGVTIHMPSGKQFPIYDAAMAYKQSATPLVVVAGKEYGTGSSRDWAAKGTLLLGVRAVIAESYERIHRSNLVGMGVLPLEFQPGQNAASLGLTGRETFAVDGIAEGLKPGKKLRVTATADDGNATTFSVTARVDTPDDVEYYRHGGLLPYVLRGLVGTA
jgi:aconitate hydratase